MIETAAFASMPLAAMTASSAHAQEGANAAAPARACVARMAFRLESGIPAERGITGGSPSPESVAANITSEGG